MIEKAINTLQHYFGYKSFRKAQEQVVESILSGIDTVAIMPTGGGKSICYQVPALIFPGITIVISPLISLMKDQVDSIKNLGINADYINSSLNNREMTAVMERLTAGEIKILYLAPERLESESFCAVMSELDISQVAVDEAHCVSQWGHDFRTSYRYIGKFINKLKHRPYVNAFTATATDKVRLDIINLIGLRTPKVFISGFDRENIKINVLKIENRLNYIINYVKENSDQSGIIYAATRKDTDRIYEKLVEAGVAAARYHAGLSDGERMKNQEDFVYDKISVIVATNAFGMGIDKSNVRFVIHYNMPKNIESYYQEIGRAGRDGEKSECILLFSPQDIITQKYLIETSVQKTERKVGEYKKLQNMIDFVHHNGCYRKYILNYFGEITEYESCGNCSNCLSEGEIVDRTIDAQKVLSCIYRMKRDFGVNTIVDVLRGSAQKKILKYGFNELSTYGIMKEYSKENLSNFINMLISHGFIGLKEGEYPTVILNENSVKVLKGQVKVEFKEMKRVNKISSDNELFELLRNLRRSIAQEEGVPPYLVFSDNTLRDMSVKYPVDQVSILNVSGVGEVKLERYGQKFIELIQHYVTENDIKVTSKVTEFDDPNKGKSDKIKTHEVTIDLIKKGMSVEDVAKERQLTESTILSHIEKYIRENGDVDLKVNFSSIVTEEQEKEIRAAAEEYGVEKLSPIKKVVSENISYEAIKAVFIKMMISQQRIIKE
ncbi:DNA helicase RecQ [Clostridium oryzae]|uniref:DNA helicase RecQ n=1 Tax=Clostridium oryzae TaxID=1450648 RepID=A0A1V4IF56_9CLOT|nr:DNA helicase RecQ [Clostridium oryzae]OPJ58275.1 ATP-dependent DNA helicase RecQ [Clostridium oryzae]